jgi:hypothetical protein
MKIYIYKLIDPRNGEPRYVGQTTKPAVRIKQHRSVRCNWSTRAWKEELLSLGLHPELEVIEETNDRRWHEREQYWIKRLRSEGANLFNIATKKLPGPGYNLSRSLETRAKLSASTKAYMASLTPEQRKARAIAASKASLESRSRWQTDDYLSKIASATRARMAKLTPEEIKASGERMRAANPYKSRSLEHCAKISAAHKLRFSKMTLEERRKLMAPAIAVNPYFRPKWTTPTFEVVAA